MLENIGFRALFENPPEKLGRSRKQALSCSSSRRQPYQLPLSNSRYAQIMILAAAPRAFCDLKRDITKQFIYRKDGRCSYHS